MKERRKRMKIMFFAILGIIFLIGGCSTLPYAKLSDEVSVKHVSWASQRFVHYETNIKNTSDNVLSLKVVCGADGDSGIVYNVKIAPWHEERITQKVPKRPDNAMSCEYYKYNR
jgi:hypothetical protein